MYMPQQPVRNMGRPAAAAAAPPEAPALPLASSYTPIQSFRNVLEEAKGLCMGTVFEELYLPLKEGGAARGR